MEMPINILREIEFGSDDYAKECKLRNEVLRLPLGRNLFNEDLSGEINQIHFGIFDGSNNLIACAIAVVCSPTEAKIRQFAVDITHQGKGHGQNMMHFIEVKLAQQGINHFVLNARMNAVSFYEKLGYKTVGQEFIEVGIPHVKMEKIIQS